MIDLSLNLAPIPPPQPVLDAVRGPHPAAAPGYGRLRAALAESLGFAPGEILPGNGSMEIVRLLCRALLGPDKRVVVMGPAWEEYAVASGDAGAKVVEIRAREEEGFRWNPARVAGEIRAARPDFLFLGNPGNPTGVYLGEREVAGILEAAAPGLMVLDEAYGEFAANPWRSGALVEGGRTVILRSFTASFSLWPIRVGYALGPPELLGRIAAARPAGALAPHVEAVGLAALREPGHLALARAAVNEGKRLLEEGLRELGLAVVRTETSYLLVRGVDAVRWRWYLLRNGVLVTECSSFGLPDTLRVGAPPAESVPEVLRAFASVLESVPPEVTA